MLYDALRAEYSDSHAEALDEDLAIALAAFTAMRLRCGIGIGGPGYGEAEQIESMLGRDSSQWEKALAKPNATKVASAAHRRRAAGQAIGKKR